MKALNMILRKYMMLVTVSLVLILGSCSSENTVMPMVKDDTIYLRGDTIVDDTIQSELGQDIVIEPGAILEFGTEGMIIANGNIIVLGTEDNPIKMIGSDDLTQHKIIQVNKDAERFETDYLEVHNGLITSKAQWNHLLNSKFTNNKDLIWSDALVRFFDHRLLIDNCMLKSIGKGDAVLVHNMEEPIVANSRISDVQDGVEFINCTNGTINGIFFKNIHDDGVDQNGCYGTIIKNNEFLNVADRAMELGAEGFGRSDSLFVDNNLFIDCNIGVDVKEQSYAKVTSCTFYNNLIAIEGLTDVDQTPVSKIEVDRCVIANTDEVAYLTEGSICSINNSISEKEISTLGENNVTTPISFHNIAERDFTITSSDFPAGYNANNIGYQKQP